MGGVCASPIAHQFGAVLGIRRSFASGSRVWLAKLQIQPSTGRDCFLLFIGGDLPHSTGRDCFLSFIGGEDASVGGMNQPIPRLHVLFWETKKGPCRFGKAPFYVENYFRNLKSSTSGGSIAFPLQTRKKQISLKTIEMIYQIGATTHPSMGMIRRKRESVVTTRIFIA